MVKISGVGSEKLKPSPVQTVEGAYYGMETPDEKYKRDVAVKKIDQEKQYDIETRKQMGVSAVEFHKIQEEMKEKGRIIRENNIPYSEIQKQQIAKQKNERKLI